ncbi:MAG: helix-turn-helix domain-containing protein [Balneolales bacterium]|nr:helix-turn-helix domain-containing protein [Balneolales bacterium]
MSKEKFSIENISFGKALQAFRKDRKLTLAGLAEAVGSSPGYLSEVERGIKKPGSDLLFALKRTFNLDLNALLEGSVEYLPDNIHVVHEPPVPYPPKNSNEELSNIASRIIAQVEASSLSTDYKLEITESVLRMINQKMEKPGNSD